MALFGLAAEEEVKGSQVYTPITGNDPLDDHHELLRAHAQCIRRLKICLRFAIALLAIASVTIFFLLFSDFTLKGNEKPLILTPVPPIPPTTVTFEPNSSYGFPPSPETDAAWNALLPPGRGFVFVDNPEQYNLQPGETTMWGEIYSVSLFHQLHCLGQLRKAHWLLMDSLMTGETRRWKQLMGHGGEHVTHCFDYLRQGIMCAGDMSMEWPRVEQDGTRFAVDGWGVPHECKSWDAISEYMQQNHFNYSTRSDIAP